MTDNEAPPARALPDGAPDAGSGAPETARRRSHGVWRFLRDVAIILVAAILISFLIKTFLIRSFYIPSGSMEPTLYINDRIIVNQLEPDLIPVSRGDVIVFKDPGGWLPPSSEPAPPPLVAAAEWLLSLVGLTAPDSNDHLIKRVIGLPGDTVACCTEFGQLTINGVPIDEPYLRLPQGVTKVSSDDFDVTVPEDSLWVMGDNRYNSADSRYNRDQPGNGFVPYDNVVGRAILISWPVDRWEWLDNHEFVFKSVEDPEAPPPSDDTSPAREDDGATAPVEDPDDPDDDDEEGAGP